MGMAGIPDSVRALVDEGHLAHLVTVNADGSPQVSVVWLGIDGDELVSAHLDERLKVRNLRRDPRAVISMESDIVEGSGLQQHLIAHCTARVTQGGAAALLQELAHVYLGPDVKFPPIDDPPPGFILRFTIDRIGGVGPWAG
jgi:PPOX class probable F420-dependent enzyme